MLGVGRRWLERETGVVRYGRRVGYLVYIVHQPVIVGCAFVIVQWSLSPALKFVVLLVASAALTAMAAELAGRLPGFRLVFGMTSRAPQSASTA